MHDRLDQGYWEDKYESGLTGWDAGVITTPIKEYIDQLSQNDLEILIPGCGYGHEARYLYDQGFKNVSVIDLAESPIEKLHRYCVDWPESSFIRGDLFDLEKQFDLIIEQTFFCALQPTLRSNYARKMWDLLKPGGRLSGVLFNRHFPFEGPPFGGTADEYRTYFEPYFEFKVFTDCYNSIKPRMGEEMFIELIKKDSLSEPD